MLTYHHFRTVNSFSLHYASILLQPFCLHLLLSAPFLPLTKHPAPQACKCLWHKGWWNGNPSGCWHSHFSGFSFIPTFLLVLEAKPPCDCAPRVWEHGNHWWQKREVQCLVWKNFFQVTNSNWKNQLWFLIAILSWLTIWHMENLILLPPNYK